MTAPSPTQLDSEAVLSLPTLQKERLPYSLINFRPFSDSAFGWLSGVLADPSLRAASFVFFLTRSLVFLIFIITTHITFREPPVDFGSKAHDLRIAIR